VRISGRSKAAAHIMLHYKELLRDRQKLLRQFLAPV
jgi:hypothetical protein